MSTAIDISNMPELLRITEEIASSQRPRKLKRNNKTIAVIMPVEKIRISHRKPDIRETLALAGSWGERDWDKVEKELDIIRHSSKPTPPFQL